MKMVSWLAGIDPKYVQALAEAEICADVIDMGRVPADHVNMLSYLFAILMGTLTGEAQEMLLGQVMMNGYEAWRVLAMNAEKTERGGRLTTMQSLMRPRFGDASTWKRAWLQWELEMVQYRAAPGTIVPDDVKISIVRVAAQAGAPELATRLRVSAYSYVGDYARMRDIIEEYWVSTDVPSTTRSSGDLEVGFVQQGVHKGAGKSFKGECRHCGGRGHKAYQCTTPSSEPDIVKSLSSVPARPQGKEERKCFNCGKVGHLSVACWSAKAIAKSSPSSGDEGKGHGKSEGKGECRIEQVGCDPARDLPSRGDCLRR